MYVPAHKIMLLIMGGYKGGTGGPDPPEKSQFYKVS